MGKVIMVASGKGGTGKTTFTANLGTALAMHGKLVVLVDMDMGLRNLDVALSLESNIVYDVSDVLDGICGIDEVLIKDNRCENLYFIAAPQTRSASDFDVEKVREFWQMLRDRFDYCLIDSPAGLEGGFKYAASGADCAIMVTVPETAALRDADRVITVLEDSNIDDVRLVINKIRPSMIEEGIMMNIDDCVDILQIPVLGLVRDDEEVIKSSLQGDVAVRNVASSAGQAFKNIALRIMGEDVPIMDIQDRKLSFIEKIRILFSK